VVIGKIGINFVKGVQMICERCDGRIHSGKIEWFNQKSYCRHCFNSVEITIERLKPLEYND
jgi:hypothetical protein